MRTLIVEDDLTCRLFLQTFLTRYGECDIAVNGKEAVEAVRAAIGSGSPYNLICMDILMPVMRGTEAVKQVRELEMERGILPDAAVKVIMTTVVDDSKTVMQSFRGHCDGYLFKPIDTGDLLCVLIQLGLVEMPGQQTGLRNE